jgi:hypothetical protein
LNDKTIGELNKIKSFDFNIFTLREATNENELVTVIFHMLAKEGIFDTLPISSAKFLLFI